MTSTFTVPQICPICSSPARWSSYTRSLSCLACGTVLDEKEIIQAIIESSRRWWRSLPDFDRDVLSEPATERALRRVAISLLGAKVEPEVVEVVVRAVNEARTRKAQIGQVDEVLLESARFVADRQRAA